MKRFRPAPLALATLAALAVAGGVVAQSTAPTPAQQKELDAARADLDRAAKRYAELNRTYGIERGQPQVYARAMARKPLVGVLLGPDAQSGVRIAGVTPESAAADAGLRSGDRLVSVDGKAIAGADGEARVASARTLLAGVDDKTRVRLAFERDGKRSEVSVTPRLDQRLFVWNDEDGSLTKFGGDVMIRRSADGRLDIDADDIEGMLPPGVAPDVRREVIRLGPGGRCDGEDCKLPMLAEAFRWSGLNLASVDGRLGRYFGTDKGVLVLSAGDELAGLQAGDVIRSIDGKAVGTPREAMAALRAKPADSTVRVEYLRDRNTGTAQVKVPKAPPLPPAPPPPPPPPPPPAPGAAMAPPAPPAPPGAVTRRQIVLVDKDGKTQTWDDDGTAPLPPLPADGKRVEKRRMVFVDDNGKTTVLEGDMAPPPPAPPPPPAAPAAPTPPAPPPPPPPPRGD